MFVRNKGVWCFCHVGTLEQHLPEGGLESCYVSGTLVGFIAIS